MSFTLALTKCNWFDWTHLDQKENEQAARKLKNAHQFWCHISFMTKNKQRLMHSCCWTVHSETVMNDSGSWFLLCSIFNNSPHQSTTNACNGIAFVSKLFINLDWAFFTTSLSWQSLLFVPLTKPNMISTNASRPCQNQIIMNTKIQQLHLVLSLVQCQHCDGSAK